MSGFFKNTSEDLPSVIDISLEDFELYKDNWMLWRALGQQTESGAFIAPVSFLEAQSIPKGMMHFFLTMDDTLGKMQAQYLKRKSKQ